MAIKIEKNVPMPADRRGGRERIYPFPHMEVGDSFVVHESKKRSVHAAAITWAKRENNAAKFCVRSLSAKDARIWRIA